MAFVRTQVAHHKIDSSVVRVSYDRLTSKFEIKESDKLIYSAYLAFMPIRKSEITINGKTYQIKIFWLLLWQSKLQDDNGVVVSELLESRRKKSVILLFYFAFVASAKVFLGLFAQN